MATNREIVEDFLDLINRQHRVREAFDRHVSRDYIQHNPTIENGPEGAIRLIEGMVSTPGFRASVKRILADGDFVASHMHVALGDEGPQLAVMDMWRFENGKMVEHWDVIQETPAQTASGNPML